MPFVNTHLVLELEKLKVVCVCVGGGGGGRWRSLTPTQGASRSVEMCTDCSSICPSTSIPSVSMAAASLPFSESCPNLPLGPILTQNYTGKEF